MLSNTCKYGIRAILYLARNTKGNEKIGIKKIASDLEIPTPFLGKVLQVLARHKLLSSTKGPHGGFGLGKNPAEIKLIDIVEILDGKDVFNVCFIGMGTCDVHHTSEYYCPIHEQFSPIRQQIVNIFTTETIAGLLENVDKS